jgi:hypothetical protein
MLRTEFPSLLPMLPRRLEWGRLRFILLVPEGVSRPTLGLVLSTPGVRVLMLAGDLRLTDALPNGLTFLLCDMLARRLLNVETEDTSALPGIDGLFESYIRVC